ncbi:hypothetical protein LCGC14_2965610, partial [marine sediment metagenome]
MKINRCCIIIISILIGIFMIPIEEPRMETRRYKDLSIVSPNFPEHTNLWIDYEGKIYMIDSVDETLLVMSDDKGATWSTLSDQAFDIVVILIDRVAERLYYSYINPGGLTAVSRYIDLTNDSDNADTSKGIAGDSFKGVDIFRTGGNTGFYNLITVDTGTWQSQIRWNLVAAGTSIQMEAGLGVDPIASIDVTQIVSDGTNHWMLYQSTTDHVFIVKSVIADGTFTNIEDLGATLNLPPKNQQGIAYDGSNILTFVLQDTGDSKYYLWTYNISGDVATKGAEYNIALMLDRHNIGTAPNELEKAFGVFNEIVYELKANRGGVIQLQDISALADDNIIAITDNFL